MDDKRCLKDEYETPSNVGWCLLVEAEYQYLDVGIYEMVQWYYKLRNKLKHMAKNDNSEVMETIQALGTHLDKSIADSQKKTTQQIGKLRSDLISHVSRQISNSEAGMTKSFDKKLESTKKEIISEIKTDKARGKLFTEKLLIILERNKLAAPEELRVLKELTA